MKNILILLICAFMTACATGRHGFDNDSVMLAAKSTVAIGSFFPVYEKSKEENPKEKPKIIGQEFKIYGSGVVVKNSKSELILITAEHVAMLVYPLPILICGIEAMSCIPAGDKLIVEFDSINQKKDLGSDWALYKIKEAPKGVIPAALSRHKLLLGQPVWSVGMPYGRSPRVTSGTVSWFLPASRENQIIAIDGFAAPGFSGGGIFSLDGKLTGIVVAIELTPKGEQSTDQVLAIPLSNIWGLH